MIDRSVLQLFTDPENQPTQYGTVTLEYMQREIAAERESCAKLCDQFDSQNPYIGQGRECAKIIRAKTT